MFESATTITYNTDAVKSTRAPHMDVMLQMPTRPDTLLASALHLPVTLFLRKGYM
jgi:hypothetical protein